MSSILPTEMFYCILENMDQTGILNARLVCRQWDCFALQLCNKMKVAVTIKNSTQMKYFLHAVKLMNNSLDLVKFNLKLQDISSEEIHNFLQEFGDKVMEYNLNVQTNISDPFNSAEMGNKLNLILRASLKTKVLRIKGNYSMFELNLPLLPNLEELNLSYDIVYRGIPGMTFSTLCTWLENAPNLKIYKSDFADLHFYKDSSHSALIPYLKAVQHISQLHLALHLNDYNPQIDHLFKASELPIKITGLKLMLSATRSFDNDYFRRGFKKLLSSQSDNLQELFIIMDGVKNISIPMMRKLQSLTISSSNKMDSFELKLKPQNFPQLQIVNMHSSIPNPFHEPFPTVKKLKLRKYQASEFWNLSFPNLKTLEASCDSLDDLKYLLFNLHRVDRLLLDLSMDMTEKYNRKGLWDLFTNNATVGSESDFYIAGINGVEIMSKCCSETNFLKLRTLQINKCTSDVATALAYSTKLGLFNKLEKLCLSIKNSASENIKETSIQKILNEYHDEVVLKTQTSHEYKPPVKSCCCIRFSVIEQD